MSTFRFKIFCQFWLALSFTVTFLTAVSRVDRPIGDVARFRNAILGRYNKTIAPGYAESPPDVGIILGISRIVYLDEKTGSLYIEGFVHVNWYDERLSWEADPNHADLAWLSVAPNDLWRPKINVFKRARGERLFRKDVPMNVLRNGHVWWTLSIQLHPTCRAGDLRWYPTDSHTCKLLIGALIPQDFFQFFFGSENRSVSSIRTYFKMPSPAWDLLSTNYSKEYYQPVGDLFYPTEEFTFEIRRRCPLVLLWSLSVLLSCMALCWASFGLPPACGALLRRTSLSMVAAILCSVLLLAVIRTVPGTGDATPIIVVVCSTGAVLTSLGVVHTVVVSVLIRKPPGDFGSLRKLPAALQILLGMEKTCEKVDVADLFSQEDSEQSIEQFRKEPRSPEPVTWHHVTEALDRVHLLVQVLLLVLVFVFACLV